jgi:hypothetical protein
VTRVLYAYFDKIGLLKFFGSLGDRVQALAVRGATCKTADSFED